MIIFLLQCHIARGSRERTEQWGISEQPIKPASRVTFSPYYWSVLSIGIEDSAVADGQHV